MCRMNVIVCDIVVELRNRNRVNATARVGKKKRTMADNYQRRARDAGPNVNIYHSYSRAHNSVAQRLLLNRSGRSV